MKNIVPYLITIIMLVMSCNIQNHNTLFKDSRITEKFSEKEIKSLNEILFYFDNYVNGFYKDVPIDSAYHYYCEEALNCSSFEELWNNLSSDKTTNDAFIKRFRNNDLFNELWIGKYLTDHATGDTLGYVLFPNWEGKYIGFVNIICEDYPQLKGYREEVKSTASIPPTLVVSFQRIHSKLNFKDEKTRLFVALHYITIKSYVEKKRN